MHKKELELLKKRFCGDQIVAKAIEILEADDQTEEAFLGAQGVLLINGLL